MRTSTEIMAALEAKLTALQWTPPSGPAEPAFQEVRRFDSTALVEAFGELIVSRQRVALIVYAGERWDDAGSGPGQVAVHRVTQFSVLVSDRFQGKRQTAAWGAGNHPGAIPLKDSVLAALAGPLLPDPEGVDCLPISSDLLDLEDLKNKQPGRVVCVLDLDCRDRTAAVFPETD